MRMAKAVSGSPPRLSIGLPVFNGERFLPDALDALLQQGFRDFEILISDNASTDATAAIARAYAARDRRIRYGRNDQNIGAVANFNRTFRLGSAPLFKWAAHDDLHRSTYLEKCLGVMDLHSDAVLTHSSTIFIDDEGKPFAVDAASGACIDPKTGVHRRPDSAAIGDRPGAAGRFWDVLSEARWGSHMFGIIRRDALLRTQLLPNFAGSDRALLAELATLGRFRSVTDALYLKRFHAEGSWALTQRELRQFLDPATKTYSRRVRQLQAYFRAAANGPPGVVPKAMCMALLIAHCAKTLAQVVTLKDERAVRHGAAWRRQTPGSARARAKCFLQTANTLPEAPRAAMLKGDCK
jgi:glycosyltransferase involved in cell wall biosynthesis